MRKVIRPKCKNEANLYAPPYPGVPGLGRCYRCHTDGHCFELKGDNALAGLASRSMNSSNASDYINKALPGVDLEE